MNAHRAIVRNAFPIIVAALAMTAHGNVSWRHEIRYVGNWHIQPNGDVQAVRTYTIPAMLYSNWKQNNLHMKEMRNFNPAISVVKVDDLTYAWDDVKRSLTLTMTVRGLAVNKGDFWEAVMAPELTFSNIDSGESKAYFHASLATPQVTVNGQDIVTFPIGATDLRNADGRTLRYRLAEPVASRIAPLWWGLFAVTFIGGLTLTGTSIAQRQTATTAPAPQ